MNNDRERADRHFGLAVGLAKDVLKALLIVNGGGAVALIAIAADNAELGASGLFAAVVFFGIGALLSVTAGIFAYFSQLAYANSQLHLTSRPEDAIGVHFHHQIYQSIAIAFVILAVIAGAVGLFRAADAVGIY